MPNTRGNRAGSGTNTGADDLLRVERDKRIIALRLEDRPLRSIANDIGCALSTVQNAIKVWMSEHGPAFEQVDELRQVQTAQIDWLYSKAAPRVMVTLRNDDGEIIYTGDGDERRPVEVIDVSMAQLVVKLWERKARLFGLDLERTTGGTPTGPPSAEYLAAALGLDPAGYEAMYGHPCALDTSGAIDGDAEELPADPPAALGSGADTH